MIIQAVCPKKVDADLKGWKTYYCSKEYVYFRERYCIPVLGFEEILDLIASVYFIFLYYYGGP